ncbi:MAG: pirin family protein [Patescibacteria group bacterium]
MEKVVHRSKDRGVGEHGWLSTRYSFSFANWYDPARMGFGALRVINDDTIAPAQGFGTHAHEDMEIITLVMSGTLTHEDSLGNRGSIPAGDVQTMSAGTGVQHSERNDSATEPLTLFQMWILPHTYDAPPRYGQQSFGNDATPGITLLVGPDGTEGALPIYQDAYLSRAVIDELHQLTYRLHDPAHGVYVFVIEGTVNVAEETLGSRDAIGLRDAEEVMLTSVTPATVLIFEVPL